MPHRHERYVGAVIEFRRALAEPVNATAYSIFRSIFGLLLFVEMLRYLGYGWLRVLYIEPSFHFGILAAAPRSMTPFVVYATAGTVALSGLGVASHIARRFFATLLTISFTAFLLLDLSHTLELNHLYLADLVALLLAVAPAPRSGRVPYWTVGVLQFQMLLVYAFAGIAKLNGDWLSGHPMTELLPPNGHELALLISYGGLVFDLAIGPLLLWRRTRRQAVLAAVAFHAANAYLFHIGIFPILASALTALFWAYSPTASPSTKPTVSRATVAGVGVYALLQIALALRPFSFKGDPSWTENGNYGSWRLMISDKVPTFFSVEILDPTSLQSSIYDPRQELTDAQLRSVAIRPELIRIYARHVATVMTTTLGVRPEVRITSRIRLNGRAAQDLIDPERDVASEAFAWDHYDWVRPVPDVTRR